MSPYDALCGVIPNILGQNTCRWVQDQIFDPFVNNILLQFSRKKELIASPTLAAPTNIRLFLQNCGSCSPTRLCFFFAFLTTAPLFSILLLTWLSNRNLALGLGCSFSLQKGRIISPLLVCITMLTVFGNIPLVVFFPEYENVQPIQYVRFGHYWGAMGRILPILARIEVLGIMTSFLFGILRTSRLHPHSAQPSKIVPWLPNIGGFLLRIWFTCRSTDAATSPVQSARVEWIWGNDVLHTGFIYQTTEQYQEDITIWLTYFMTMFIVSSAIIISYTARQEHGEYDHL
jgi:hypothetical protein